MSDFVRLPDGSLIMTGQPKPQPSSWDRFRASLSRFFQSRPQPAPWWIEQPPPAPVATVPSPVPATSGAAVPLAPGGQWGAVEAAAAHQQNVASELGDYSQKVLSNPYFMGE